jgi:hypothetical protein
VTTYKVHVWMSSSLVILGLRFCCFEVGERVSVGTNHDSREREHAQHNPDTHSQQPTSLATEHLNQSKDRRSWAQRGPAWFSVRSNEGPAPFRRSVVTPS